MAKDTNGNRTCSNPHCERRIPKSRKFQYCTACGHQYGKGYTAGRRRGEAHIRSRLKEVVADSGDIEDMLMNLSELTSTR